MGSTTLHWVQRRAWLLAVVGAVVLALGSTTWWVTHPDVFDDAGDYGVRADPRPVGRTMYFGIVTTSSRDERRELELRSVTPVVRANTAEAELTVYLCEIAPDSPYGAIVGQRKRPSRVCGTLEPVTDGMRFLTGKGTPRQQLVLAVRTTKRGVVKVKGAEVSYRDGLRRGTEVTGGYLTYRAR